MDAYMLILLSTKNLRLSKKKQIYLYNLYNIKYIYKNFNKIFIRGNKTRSKRLYKRNILFRRSFKKAVYNFYKNYNK